MRKIAYGLLAGLFWASQTQAAFIENYAQFQKLSQDGRQAFVMGVFDAKYAVKSVADPYSMVDGPAVMQCMLKNQMNSELVLKLVENYYARVPASWGEFPSVVVQWAVVEMCKAQMNDARAKAGLMLYP